LEELKETTNRLVGWSGSNCIKNMDRFVEIHPRVPKLYLRVFPQGAAGLLVTGRAVQRGTVGDKGETAGRAGNGSC